MSQTLSDSSVQALSDLLEGMLWYTGEEELELLQEGARARFTSHSHVRALFRKAILRYNRYLINIKFDNETKSIQDDIQEFLHNLQHRDLRDSFRLMKLIDLSLLDIIHCEN